ncbi:unnamed protein product, partial [Allacma fusca]
MGSSRQQIFWQLNMILALSHVIFVYIRCIQVELEVIPVTKYQFIYMRFMGACYSLGAILHFGVELEVIPVTKYQFIYMRFVGSCYSLGAILHFGVIHKRTEIVEFANQLIEAVIKFE